MEAIRFRAANTILNKPDSMKDEECGSLYVQNANGSFLSAWKPSDDDIRDLKHGGVIVLEIVGGAHPPVAMITTRNKNYSVKVSD